MAFPPAPNAIPAQGRRLHLGATVEGWLTPSAEARLARLPDVLRQAFHWSASDVSLPLPLNTTEANAFLATLAQALKTTQALPDWRNEVLDLVTPSGTASGLVLERSVFRLLGLTTRCVYAVASTEAGEVWLGKRSLGKRLNPGKFVPLASGLVAAHETPTVAVARETQEEAGLEAPHVAFQLHAPRLLTSHAVPEGWMHELAFVYRATLSPLQTPRNTDGEVDHFELVSKETLIRYHAEQRLTEETATVLSFLGLLNEAAPHSLLKTATSS